MPTHYSQTWQHLPDYGAYHATLIADPALPSKWRPGEEVIYLLGFEGELLNGSTPEIKLGRMLASRLSETLPIPILDRWAVTLWEAGSKKELIGELAASGDCPSGHWVHVTESGWKEVITTLVEQGEISIR